MGTGYFAPIWSQGRDQARGSVLTKEHDQSRFTKAAWHVHAIHLSSWWVEREMMNLSHESGLPAVSLGAGRVVHKVGSARWEIRSIDVLELVQDLMRRLDDVFASRENIIHDSPIVRIVRVPASGDADTRLLLRKMNYGKRSARIRDIFRPAGSIRAFHNALAMERALVPTPRVLAAGVLR